MIFRSFRGASASVTLACFLAVSAYAQNPVSVEGKDEPPLASEDPAVPAASQNPSSELPTRLSPYGNFGFTTLVRDHALLWSSPVRSPRRMLKVLPFVAATAVALSLDHPIASRLPNSNDQIRYSKAVSHAGAYYSVGAAAGAFVAAGLAAHDARAVETGILAAQALAHGESIAQMLKFAGGRERPDFGDATRGRFWHGQQSFPSGHAMGTWAVATVISKEYHHNRFIRYGIYLLPIAVSASRLGARRHFLSDVVAGGSIGYLIGSWVYDRHHNPALGGAGIKRHGVLIRPDFGVNPKWGGFTVGLNISR